MKKNLSILYVLGITLLTMMGCKDDDERVFDEPAAVRAQIDVAELNASLMTASTFRGTYFPKNDEFGGSVIYFKFGADGKVSMSSNFDSEVAITDSQYDIRQNTSTELVFTTFNHLQKLSDNNVSGLRGTGFKGASNFIYKGTGTEGSIELFEIRNEATMILTPITDAEFLASPEVALKSFDNENLLIPSATNSVFKTLEIKGADSIGSFDLSFDFLRLFATAENRADNGSIANTIKFGFAFTEDGLTVSPAIDFAGSKFEDFVYNNETENFVSTVEGATAILGSANEPAFITDDYLEILAKRQGTPSFAYRPYTWGDNVLTSRGFDVVIDDINARFASAGLGFVFDNFQLNLGTVANDGCESILFFFFRQLSDNTVFRADYCLSQATVKDKKIFVKYNGFRPGSASASFASAGAQPLIDFFTSEAGLIATTEGSFSAIAPNGSPTNFSNRSGTFASASSPSQRVYILFFN